MAVKMTENCKDQRSKPIIHAGFKVQEMIEWE